MRRLDNIPQVDYTILVHLWNIKSRETKGVVVILKHGILGLLNYHPMTGYEIMLVFRDSLRFFWSAQTSQIYRELQTLETKGWVGKTPVPQQSKPDKNIYAITPEGHDELLRWLSDGMPELSSRSHILMKVFFLGERGPEENIRYFEALKEYCGALLESLDMAQGNIGQYRALIDDRGRAAYWEMTVDFGRRNMKMYMDWTQSCIDRLKGEQA